MKHILLVEDDSDIASLLRLNLEDEGYAITHEADGARALQLLDRTHWDAVILDLMLPNVDGLEICRRIRQLTRYLPIIIISARSSETDRITGLETGADDYLAKPFSVQELIARIKALFRRQQAMGQAQTSGTIVAHGLTLDPLARSVRLHGKRGGSHAARIRVALVFCPSPRRGLFAAGAAGTGLGLSARRLRAHC